MPLPVTSIYAALLALLGIVLAGLVGRARSKTTVSLGDGDNAGIVEANRRHMNWVENVPVTLLLLAMVELNGAPKDWVHALGAVLLVARLLHPFGIEIAKMNTWQRGAGAGLSFLVTIGCAGTLLWQAVLR